MYHLKNTQLAVDILDPIADQARFGVRYCTGGYIYQVSDEKHGALLTGPTYPESFNWFDGQGIPDAFNLSPLRKPDNTDAEVEIIGIGRCDLIQKQVLTFCEWQVTKSADAITMITQQQFHDHDLKLERGVQLMERTIRSFTKITNQGTSFIPMVWFPHPFYPQTATPELMRLNIPIAMPDNAGYVLQDNGFIARRNWPEQAGFYQPLDHQAQSPLTITQRHPQLGLVSASCSYVPDFFPIWGNQHTFSWEPFLERRIAPQQSLEWWIDYDF